MQFPKSALAVEALPSNCRNLENCVLGILIPNLIEFAYALQQSKEVLVTTRSSASIFVAVLYCCLVDRLLPAFMRNDFLYLLAFCVLTMECECLKD